MQEQENGAATLDPSTDQSQTPGTTDQVATETAAESAPENLPEAVTEETQPNDATPVAEASPEVSNPPEVAGSEAGGEAATAAPAGETSHPPTETDLLRKQILELTLSLDVANNRLTRLSSHDQRVIAAEREVASCEADVNECKSSLKEAKDRFDKAVDRLRTEIRNRDGQSELPFKDAPRETAPTAAQGGDWFGTPKPVDQSSNTADAAPQVEDPFAKTPLTQIGVSPTVAEKLKGLDPMVETVGDLERLIKSGGFVPGRHKGIGPETINKVSELYTAFRSEHPNPNVKEIPMVDGTHDPVQYHAGQIARADGKDLDTNPNSTDAEHAFNSWVAGWSAKDEELTKTSDVDTTPGDIFGEGVEEEEEPETTTVAIDGLDEFEGIEAEVVIVHLSSGKFESIVNASVTDGNEGEDPVTATLREKRDGLDPITWDTSREALGAGCERLAAFFRAKGLEEEATIVDQFAAKLGKAEHDSDVDDALKWCAEILDLAPQIPSAGEDFAKGVQETARRMQSWIEEHNHVTKDQWDALQNMVTAVKNWFHD